jgi:hypothetical protein
MKRFVTQKKQETGEKTADAGYWNILRGEKWLNKPAKSMSHYSKIQSFNSKKQS